MLTLKWKIVFSSAGTYVINGNDSAYTNQLQGIWFVRPVIITIIETDAYNQIENCRDVG